MSMTKDMWMDEIETVCEDFRVERFDRAEAMDRLKRLGLDTDEAANLLNGAIA